VEIKSCQNIKNLKLLKTIFNGSEVLKIERKVFSTNYFKGLETSHTSFCTTGEPFITADGDP